MLYCTVPDYLLIIFFATTEAARRTRRCTTGPVANDPLEEPRSSATFRIAPWLAAQLRYLEWEIWYWSRCMLATELKIDYFGLHHLTNANSLFWPNTKWTFTMQRNACWHPWELHSSNATAELARSRESPHRSKNHILRRPIITIP